MPGASNEGPHAVVHVDLDGALDIYRVHGWRWPTKSGGDPVFDTGLPALLDLLQEAGVPATLFVIARKLSEPAALSRLREAVRRGHEVASHTIHHRPLSRLSRAEKRQEIFDSRAMLSDALGVPVQGFRAPNFDLDRESLELVAEAGYAWDSSLRPGARTAASAGLAEVSPFPFRPLTGSELVELPLPKHRPLPFPFHPSYGLVLGERYVELGLRRFRRMNAPLVFLFHLTDLCDPLSRELAAGPAKRFFTLSYLSAEAKGRHCRRMLAQVRGRFEVARSRDLAERAPRRSA